MPSVVSSTLPAPSRKRLELVGERLPGSIVMHSEGEMHGIRRSQIHGLNFCWPRCFRSGSMNRPSLSSASRQYVTVPVVLVARQFTNP